MQFAKLFSLHNEVILYIFFGVLTTAINYIVYFLCLLCFNMHYATSNFWAWFIAVIFAFFTNKRYVFNSLNFDFSTTVREGWQFISARVISVVIETILLWIFIDQFFFDEKIVKIFTNFVVIVLNYIFSKYYIFKQKN